MDFWDAVSRGMDRLANKLDSYSDRTGGYGSHSDTGFTIMDKDYCWEDLDYVGEDTLQRHVVSGACRIVDKYGQIVDRGTQEQLEQEMARRSANLAANLHAGGPSYSTPYSPQAVTPAFSTPITPVAPMNGAPNYPLPAAPVNPYVGSDPAVQKLSSLPPKQQPVQARYGDIIGVVRRNGAYEHYGIYVSDTCVIHYAIPASMTIGHATVHATSLRNFLRDDSEYFVLDFPKPYQPPVVLGAQGSSPARDPNSEELALNLQRQYGYHLYTPEETVARARSRLGETHYSLLTNNCEHFVFWCKTGVSESMQVSSMLQSLLNSQNWQFRVPLFR